MPGEGRAPLPAILGRLAQPLYRLEIARRNRAYDRSRGVTRLDRPVLSVGNLSVGGTGKTPTVRALLRILLDAGHHPCVAMRGYKATRRRESDEAAAHRLAYPTVPVVAQPDRIAGLAALFETDIGRRVDCIVLDDGFQHRRLARDLDLVLIDATRPPFDDRLLPAGWLREPPAALARADALLITHADRVDDTTLEDLAARLRALAPKALLATARHAWTCVAVAEDGREQRFPVSWLRGKRVVAACAIGNPDGFLTPLAKATGTPLARTIVKRDHDPYSPSTIDQIAEAARAVAADAIVITEKDWSKLADVRDDRWPCPVARPLLEIQFLDQGPALRDAVLRAAAR